MTSESKIHTACSDVSLEFTHESEEREMKQTQRGIVTFDHKHCASWLDRHSSPSSPESLTVSYRNPWSDSPAGGMAN